MVKSGSKFRVQGSGFKVQGSRFKVQSSRFKVQSSKFKVQSLLVPKLQLGNPVQEAPASCQGNKCRARA